LVLFGSGLGAGWLQRFGKEQNQAEKYEDPSGNADALE
jgi:hypothetical protein